MCSVKYRKSSKRYRIGIKINLAFISEHHVLTSEYYSASCICLHADISDLFPYSVVLFIYLFYKNYRAIQCYMFKDIIPWPNCTFLCLV